MYCTFICEIIQLIKFLYSCKKVSLFEEYDHLKSDLKSEVQFRPYDLSDLALHQITDLWS